LTGSSPLRLRLDSDALTSNWRWLAAQSGAASCGAAVKADGYGLGAVEVVKRLAAAGCTDFFVATWAEANALMPLPRGASLSVLHGVREEDMPDAVASPARPVLNALDQVKRWRPTGLPCDVMIDTGMNRLGLSVRDVADGALAGLNIQTLMSHLASADEDVPQNEAQRAAFAQLRGMTTAQRMSLSNSAGISLGADYAFDLTRPGLSLYGGIARANAAAHIRQTVFPEAQILQRRRINAGDSVGYNATFTAERTTEIAIVNLGYADGYFRGFSGVGTAGQGRFPVTGRVSMDLTAISVDAAPELVEGDWVQLDFALPAAARASGVSQYELLTSLGARYDRVWQ
jgi:alanine racemase